MSWATASSPERPAWLGCAAIWGIDGGVSRCGVAFAGDGRRSNRTRWAGLVDRRVVPPAGLGGPVVASRRPLAQRRAERRAASRIDSPVELDCPADPDDSRLAGLPGPRSCLPLARQ